MILISKNDTKSQTKCIFVVLAQRVRFPLGSHIGKKAYPGQTAPEELSDQGTLYLQRRKNVVE